MPTLIFLGIAVLYAMVFAAVLLVGIPEVCSQLGARVFPTAIICINNPDTEA